ncbi:MAG: hypothetical protein LBE97_01275 [Holosporales bacterium]|jgi:hypothetical protein|nr:hypothetical protein [Holosporales bacterium]
MRKIIATAISVFLLIGNAMSSSENYIPKEFWTDEAAVKEILNQVVPTALEELKGIRYECAESRYYALSEKIVELTYPHMQKYMLNNNLTIPTLKEVADSIGIDVCPGFHELSDDERTQFLDAMRHPDVLYENSCVFLDFVGKIIEDELY